jgi:hypothetical protein
MDKKLKKLNLEVERKNHEKFEEEKIEKPM